MKRTAAWLSVLAIGCTAAPVRDGTAVIDPAYVVESATDARTQAEAALARDAWRREARFLEAIDPGRALRQTRVPAAEIEAGLWSGEELAAIGRAIFDHPFTRAEGLGAGTEARLVRVLGAGGYDARRCTACHARGGGTGADATYLDGDGDSIASALGRSPPALDGAAVLELLASEMTRDLAALRQGAITTARSAGTRATAELVTHGVRFGTLSAEANGTVDATGIVGIDADLVVRPFGWKGRHATLRAAIEEELARHLGIEAGGDRDADGVESELVEGQLVALTVALGLRPLPIVEVSEQPDYALWHARGEELFDSLGCASCHTPSMTLGSAEWSPGASLAIDLRAIGPRPSRDVEGTLRVWLYSDLRRHDMGETLREPRDDGTVSSSAFRTPPLWAVAETAPYLHDGRAPSIQDAILAHDGEARAARDAYAALTEAERAPLRVFLAGLTRNARLDTP
jgi:hypothetical protein